MQKLVADLQEGDLVDLEGDPYADPRRDHPEFEFEYQEVLTVEQETPECVAVGFDFDVIGFPTNHVLTVMERDDESAESDSR